MGARVAKRARTSANCLSKTSSLELLLDSESGPCVERCVDADEVKSRSRCRVSVGTLTVLAFSVLGSVMLKTKSRRSSIVRDRETWAMGFGSVSCAVDGGGGS